MSLTQNNLSQLQARIDAGDRAGFYILYYNLTGSEQALVQAQVSSYSGMYGQLAFFSNAAAKAYLGNQYTETTDQFSLAIAADLNNRIKSSVNSGESGVFSNDDILGFAKEQWVVRDLGDYFPGNILLPKNTILGTFFGQSTVSSFVIDVAGGLLMHGNEAGRLDDPSAYGLFNRPFDVPAGGQRLTSLDGRVSYMVDASGKTVYGSVVDSHTASLATATTQNNQIQITSSVQGPDGVTNVTSTLNTVDVDGGRIVTGQTTTVTTEGGILTFVAGSSGSSTLVVGGDGSHFSEWQLH
jgi:hypothetical protein